MKATGIISVATMATAAYAAPLVDELLDTVEGVVGGVPIVGDLLEQVPAADMADGILNRLPTSGLVERLPITDILDNLPVNSIVEGLSVSEITDKIPVVNGVSESLPVKNKRIVDNVVSGIPLLGGLLDQVAVTDLLDGVLGNLPVASIVNGLPTQDIIDRLPVKDMLERLPLGNVVDQLDLENVAPVNTNNKRVVGDLTGELPLVGAILDRLPLDGLLDGVVERLPVQDIVDRLPIDGLVSHLPVNDIVKALPVKRDAPEQVNVVEKIEKLVVNVKEHTKVINATVEKVEGSTLKKSEANTQVIDQIKGIQLDLTKIVSDLTSDAGIPVAPAQVDRVLELLNVLVAELLATVQSLVTVLGLRVQLVSLLHSVFSLVANLLKVVTGLLAGLLPGLVAGLSPLLAGLGNGLLAPILTPLVALVAGIAGP